MVKLLGKVLSSPFSQNNFLLPLRADPNENDSHPQSEATVTIMIIIQPSVGKACRPDEDR
jgi:hypothetical protein